MKSLFKKTWKILTVVKPVFNNAFRLCIYFFLKSSHLITDDLKVIKEVCAEGEGITLEELVSEYDLDEKYFWHITCVAEYQLRAFKRFTVEQNSFKQGSPDAVFLITSELPSDFGKCFTLKNC